ncbi:MULTISPECIES: hypothetical protein [unclassified Mesorhizobium]|uniref:hypothetical protein n=1 Tax=unclassified Mesorhizobium TaxID=325217 RepID=UPI0016787EDF|nr:MULTISPECIES: hypothetical protein [unclassified Mesorhizobium]
MGGAVATFKADKRQALWDFVHGMAGAPAPKGLAERQKPGLVKTLKGEEMLHHASLKDFWVLAERCRC